MCAYRQTYIQIHIEREKREKEYAYLQAINIE